MRDKNYPYENLVSDLTIGHEFEFEYNGNMYSFSNSRKGYHLMKYGDETSTTFQTPQELLSKGRIEGMRIQKIWADVKNLTIF